jgi:hypothetical protein
MKTPSEVAALSPTIGDSKMMAILMHGKEESKQSLASRFSSVGYAPWALEKSVTSRGASGYEASLGPV